MLGSGANGAKLLSVVLLLTTSKSELESRLASDSLSSAITSHHTHVVWHGPPCVGPGPLILGRGAAGMRAIPSPVRQHMFVGNLVLHHS